MSELEALLRERAGYLARGRKDRVAQVDAALKRLGFAAESEPEAAVVERPEKAVKAKPRRR